MPTIDVNGAGIAYQRFGAGEPVILLHSSVSSSTQWSALCEQLKDDFLVLAPDLHGYGENDPWPARRRIRLADEAAIVEALAATCAGPIHLVGHSYGGAVALKAALDGRVALSSLTLLEPAAFNILWHSDPRAARFFGEIRQLSDAVWVAMSQDDRLGAMTCFVDYWNGRGAWSRLTPRQQKKMLATADKVPQDFLAIITEPRVLEDYRCLASPTLLLRGTESPAPTRRIVALLESVLPDVRVAAVQGAGHMAPLTHSAPVNAAIVEHLQSHREIRRRAA